MRIANPIYDAVFKFLLEDLDIAREMLSVILGEEIETLEIKTQETATQTPTSGVGILRYDFRAVFKNRLGEHKKALIELQKAKQLLDIMRFRRYLGENYRKADAYQDNGDSKSAPLEIVTIYFLGFRLANVPYAALKSNNCYQDLMTGEYLKEGIKEPFVNLLDHEAFYIQIPRLEAKLQTRLEKVLLVFDQKNRTDDIHELEFKGPADDPLVSKMVQRLQFAIADEEIQRQMEVEDEIENLLLDKDRQIEVAKNEAEAAKNEAEAAKNEAEAAKNEAEKLRQKILALGINPNEI